MTNYRKKLNFLTIIFVLTGLTGAAMASGLPTPAPESPTCAADIKAGIYIRSWLEAQRETLQNENIISKPDSVLEYSCFGSYLNILAREAENMFSENTDAWEGNVGIITNTSLDEDLQGLVGASTATYINTNFGHDYLGGRMTGSNYTPAAVSGGAYTCDVMNTVWMYAKCSNFMSGSGDGFLTFRQHVSNDPRVYPADCASPDPRMATYTQAFEALTGAGVQPWRTQMRTTMTNVLNNARNIQNATACTATPAIRTGLIYYNEGATINDSVCVNPRCYFNGGSACSPL